jgi:hypothetical protein
VVLGWFCLELYFIFVRWCGWGEIDVVSFSGAVVGGSCHGDMVRAPYSVPSSSVYAVICPVHTLRIL